ncbi:MAG: 4Fe-4S binding protein [Clostridiales Family XIII bacterium]|jgi:Fe-S-cluster-containing dehydrogenase component|nr:4Fe-4S binding protein [Clostridiales Family XIII bacterium]
MAKAFLIDIAKCSGCYNCQIACKDEHCGNEWKPYAAAQPDTGQFWMRVVEHVRGTIPKVKVHYVPTLCGHCARPACVEACTAGAATQRDDGLVLLDPDICKGCGACAEACPYGVIFHNEALGISQKCTGCAHLLDNGYVLPRCAEQCPTDALRFGEEADFADELAGAAVLRPESGLAPKVYYRNMPGQFIAGTVFDADAREVLIGARCRALTGGKTYEATTDEYGDFWFRDLPAGRFDIAIEPKGYRAAYYYGVESEGGVNLGDIGLVRG